MLDLAEQLTMMDRIKDEYMKGDLVMSELLRNEEFDGLSKASKIHLLVWAGEDEYAEFTLNTTVGDIITYSMDDFEMRAKEIADESYKKALRIIKKIRWQDHYNTRKRSRRF